MNVAHRTLAVAVTALVLVTAAWAQDAPPQDDVLQRYQLAIENLDAAVAALPSDDVAARDELDRAMSALRTLSRGGNMTFVESLDRVFERARTAIVNESQADLAVQAHVLRGGFQRLLYESALQAAVEGELDTARERLLRLTADIGVGEARAAQVNQEEAVGPLRRILEAGTAEQVSARLASLNEAGAPEDLDAAYQALAAAYGDYLIVQDSPRLEAATNTRFVEAANALVDGRAEDYLAAVGGLSRDLAALAEQADAALAGEAADAAEDAAAEDAPAVQDLPDSAAAGAEATAEADGAAAVDPAGADVDASGTAASDEAGETLTVAQEGAAQESAGQEGAAQDGTAQEGAGDAAGASDGQPAEEVEPIDAGVRARIEAELAAQREEERIAALDGDLAAVGVAAGQRPALIERLREVEVARLSDVERDLAATADRFTSAVHRGERERARLLLGEVRSRYGQTLGPVVRSVAADADLETDRLLRRLEEAPQLRVQDAALLASQLDAVSERLSAARAPFSHEAIRSVADVWGGLPRAVVMIVLGLLAFVPLRYLNLAFGGGNRNWQLVGSALFLLLLPVIYEGLAAAGALLAEPVDVPMLGSLTTWSMFQNDLTQAAWAAVTLVALLMATRGFYGICVQFGLLGRTNVRDTASDTKASRDDTLVDWDEEF